MILDYEPPASRTLERMRRRQALQYRLEAWWERYGLPAFLTFGAVLIGYMMASGL